MEVSVEKYINNIIQIDSILVGSVTKRYSPCGKVNCICSKGKQFWHGPYYIWTRKENGKTITKSLSQKQAKFTKKAIKNMRKLQKNIMDWRNESLKRMLEMES
jgi:hypothetical protein